AKRSLVLIPLQSSSKASSFRYLRRVCTDPPATRPVRPRFLPVIANHRLLRELPPFVIQFVADACSCAGRSGCILARRVFFATSRLSLGLACIVCVAPPPCLCGPHVRGSLALRGFVAGAVQPYRRDLAGRVDALRERAGESSRPSPSIREETGDRILSSSNTTARASPTSPIDSSSPLEPVRHDRDSKLRVAWCSALPEELRQRVSAATARERDKTRGGFGQGSAGGQQREGARGEAGMARPMGLVYLPSEDDRIARGIY
ncbi:hypothetical protein EJB05_48273, partial [Eragrostis curvula]